MTGTTRAFPHYAFFLALAGLFLTLRLAMMLGEGLPPPVFAAGLALWAMVLYWGLVVILLRSDPRVWRPGTRWYQRHVAPAPAEERAAVLPALRATLAPQLQRELIIMAAVGAAMGMIGQGTGILVLAVALAALAAWGIGVALGLRTQP